MLPSQFKRLSELLRSLIESLRNVKEATNQQENAIRDGGKASIEKERETAAAITSAIREAASDVPQYEKTQRDKEYGLQKGLLWATIGAGIAAAVYAAIAARQMCIMQRTYGEIQKQTTLFSSQLKGTEAAFLDITVQIGTQVGDFDLPFNGFKLIARNTGHSIARDVQIDVRISRLTTDGKMIGEPMSFIYSVPAIDYKPGTSEFYRRTIFEDSAEASEILHAASALEQTVKLEVHYRYGDGFGDTIRGDIPCREFLLRDWIPCENFPSILKDAQTKH